ncbi:MAG: DUF1599 domain-containing protein [Bacteroidales bacterium]
MCETAGTDQQYSQIIKQCKEVFLQKMHDYGNAWRILRPSSLTDQIYIKAHRIRSLQNKGTQKIPEGIIPEFIGIINYSIMGLIQLEWGVSDAIDADDKPIKEAYDTFFEQARSLMHNKNHDYGEAWREMRVSSLTDIILMKLLRIKQIENNQGITSCSEGIDANFYDIINYAVFAMIKLELE